ncbi:MAG: hypothetical protein GY853_01250 [PVC group bacterium]|nr:hypothetical protein [PVC group bacterium]
MQINDIQTMISIALNTKPKDRKRTTQTRAETMQILADMANEAQAALLEYECIKQAVREHKDSSDIITRAKLIFNEKVKK